MSTKSETFTVVDSAFVTEADAVAALESRGCDVVVADVEANERGLHWHDFQAILAVVEGRLTVEDASGATFECGPGTLLQAPRAALHTERVEAGRIAFGFPDGRPDFSAGVNRDPAEHPDAD